jgi:hypothetical protein
MPLYYDEATHLHLLVTVFHMKPTSRRLVETVVVGKILMLDSKDVPHVIALAPVPVIEIISVCPSVGVPDRPEVNEVISAA